MEAAGQSRGTAIDGVLSRDPFGIEVEVVPRVSTLLARQFGPVPSGLRRAMLGREARQID